MNLKTIFVLTVSCLLLILSISVSAKKPSDTVLVDCTKGDSINVALENTAEELIIEISGMPRILSPVAEKQSEICGVHKAVAIDIGGTPFALTCHQGKTVILFTWSTGISVC